MGDAAGLRRAIWQSTTGTAPFLIVNGPVRERLGLNSTGNVFGSGFRANATFGRAIRLGAINAFGLRPHELDQATQGTPAKYSACIAENEKESPWPALHEEFGLMAADSAVTAMVIRSCVHIETGCPAAPRWRLPADHPDALPVSGTSEVFHVLTSPEAVLVVVAGAGNAGVSAVVETFGARGGPPPVVRVRDLGPGCLACTGRSEAVDDEASEAGSRGSCRRLVGGSRGRRGCSW